MATSWDNFKKKKSWDPETVLPLMGATVSAGTASKMEGLTGLTSVCNRV